MGLLDGFRGAVPAMPVMLLRDGSGGDGDEPTPTQAIDALIADIVAKRRSGFGMEQARRLPAVQRAYQLVSMAASFLPLAYRDGVVMARQPRYVTNPAAYDDRFEFVEQTAYSLLDHGCAYWRLYGAGDDPSRSAFVIPHEEVDAQWGMRPVTRTYRWQGRPLRTDGPNPELIHITIGRRAGELHGRGPLEQGLDALYPVWEAEEFAANFFTTGGLPLIVIKTASGLTDEEARALKRQWVESRQTPGPAIAGGGQDVDVPNVDPQRAQLQEARSFGATVAATLFGIPAALLHVQTSGATITYTNPAGAVEELVKSTIAPRYLAPIERAWSRLGPSTQTVRFDLADMQRADIAGRFALYAQAAGIRDEATGESLMTVREMRAYEGWGAADTEAGHQFDPVEAPEPVAVAA